MQAAIIFIIIFIVLVAIVIVVPILLRTTISDFFGGLTPFGSSRPEILKTANGGITWVSLPVLGERERVGRLLDFTNDPVEGENLFASFLEGGLRISQDGGAIWSLAVDGLVAISPQSSIFDILVSRQNNQQTLFLALFSNGIGSLVVKKGNKFERIYTAPLADVAVSAVALHPIDGRIYVGTTQGALLVSSNQGGSWRLLRWFPGSIAFIKINPATAVLWVYTDERRLFRSLDGGESWQEMTGALRKVDRGADEVSTLAFHPTNTLTVFAGTRLGLLRSVDGGENWFLVRTSIPPELLPVRAVVFNPQNSNEIFLAAGSQIHRSVDGGFTWTSILVPTTKTIVSLLIDSNNSKIIYVGVQ